MTPSERHARNLARVAELTDEGAVVGPFPAVLALIRGVIERHAPQDSNVWCLACDLPHEDCADYLAAENALGVGDE
jgi:hypothetical protein